MARARALKAAVVMLAAGFAHSVRIHAQAAPAPRAIAIRNVEILPVSGARIPRGTVVVRGDSLAAVGPDAPLPAGAEVIDGTGLTAVPGFFDSFTGLGLVEVANVPAANDGQETADPVAGHLRAHDGFFLDSELLPVTRAAGILVVLSAPGPAPVISGQPALMRTAGTTLAEATVVPSAGLLVNLGEAPKRAFGERGRSPQTRMGIAAILRQALVQAKEYGAKRAADPKTAVDARLEPLAEAIGGKLLTLVRANRRDDIETALRLADEFGLRIVLVGGADAPRMAPELARRKIPVLVAIDQQPDVIETAGASYDGAAVLTRAGVVVAFHSSETTLSRQLVANVGLAVAYGLPYDEALKALTLNPARIFGVEERLGSLEVGKEATFVLTRGDPLQVRSPVVSVFVRGQRLAPRSYQTTLCEQYVTSRKGDIPCLPR